MSDLLIAIKRRRLRELNQQADEIRRALVLSPNDTRLGQALVSVLNKASVIESELEGTT